MLNCIEDYILEYNQLSDKTVLVRVDLNVPIVNGVISDYTRVDVSCSNLIGILKKSGCQIILVSHLGRPCGLDKSLSFRKIFNDIKSRINYLLNNQTDNDHEEIKMPTIYDIELIPCDEQSYSSYFTKVKDRLVEISNIKNKLRNNLILLDNIRFFPEETSNDPFFAAELASLADIYVNGALSCSHRQHASISSISTHFPSSALYAGYALSKEIKVLNYISDIMKERFYKKLPKTKDILLVIAGSKISTKIGVIKNLINKVDKIFVAGAMANNFMKYDGLDVGKSLIEDAASKIIAELYDYIKTHGSKVLYPNFMFNELPSITELDSNTQGEDNPHQMMQKIQYPQDCTVYHSLPQEKIDDSLCSTVDIQNIKEEDIILDIGNKTIQKLEKLLTNSKLVLWNGPLGMFEYEPFNRGTNSFIELIIKYASKGCKFIIGGGDTISAINHSKMILSSKNKKDLDAKTIEENIIFITAGGAFLELLEGKNLPGLLYLLKNDNTN